MRGLGELAVVSNLPDGVVELFGLLTRLGDPWLLLGVLALLYTVSEWFSLDRRRVACVFAAAFTALGVTLALKSAFALPRPPGAFESGYGFPSGHALGTTVVWGTGAALFDVGRRRLRRLLAGVVVLVVAVSRVVIGVHYLVDVVVGVAVGLVVIYAALELGPGRATDGGPAVSHAAVDRVFALAAATTLVALALSRSPDTLLTVGAALGGWLGWRVVEPSLERAALSRSFSRIAVVGVALPVVLGGLLAVDAAASAATVPDLLAMGGAGACVALLFALPRLSARLVGADASG